MSKDEETNEISSHVAIPISHEEARLSYELMLRDRAFLNDKVGAVMVAFLNTIADESGAHGHPGGPARALMLAMAIRACDEKGNRPKEPQATFGLTLLYYTWLGEDVDVFKPEAERAPEGHEA